MYKLFYLITFILLAEVVGISNCGFNLGVVLVSFCCGYTSATFSYKLEHISRGFTRRK